MFFFLYLFAWWKESIFLIKENFNKNIKIFLLLEYTRNLKIYCWPFHIILIFLLLWVKKGRKYKWQYFRVRVICNPKGLGLFFSVNKTFCDRCVYFIYKIFFCIFSLHSPEPDIFSTEEHTKLKPSDLIKCCYMKSRPID